MSDEREVDWPEFEAESRKRGRCPYSGLVLHMDGEGRQGSASCDMCDCFGFNPADVKVHPRPLHVARWKVTRKKCGKCERGFADSTRSSICDQCLADALGLDLGAFGRFPR